jgi:alcohol dehydrogenase class IV
MSFDFFAPGRIRFAQGAFSELPELCAAKGKRFLILTGGGSLKRSGKLDMLTNALTARGVSYVFAAGVTHEPQVEDVDAAVSIGLDFQADAVLAIGGGSVLDTGKAASGVLTNGGSVRNYLEGVGNKKLSFDPLPFIAVPTTSGTGTEATKNAVISSAKEGFKKSIRDDRLLPDIALIDPQLTISSPKSVTAASGMDAICQLIESYTSKNANAFCDALALYNIPIALKAVKRCYDVPDDTEAREQMSMAALSSGLCLANAGLGAAHGFAAGLGVILGLPHGLCCGMLLPHVMRLNSEKGVSKYIELVRSLYPSHTNETHAVLRLIEKIESLNSAMGIPKDLKHLNIPRSQVEVLAAASMGSSMKKNPVELTLQECKDFIKSLI